MMKLSEVYEGWRNHLFPPSKIKKLIKKVSDERMEICDQCAYNSKFHKTMRPDEHCIECGCTLSAKTKCLSCQCPLPSPKWEAEVTEDQEEEFIVEGLIEYDDV